jgi:quercetin dioxygenase-like cupin family protein
MSGKEPERKRDALQAEAADRVPQVRDVPDLVHVDLFGGKGQVLVRDLLRGARAGPFVAVLACELEAGGSVGTHRQEHCPEIVVCTAGRGRARVDGAPIELGPGAVVWLPLGSVLSLENLSGDEALAYLIVKARG